MKISAIVPVYNSERYVRRCIDSIIKQSYQKWELILIDDGSVDSSFSILREYEKQDSRIKVIHQDNKGPGIARNVGISHATGDYIVFVDSDDRISQDYFDLLSKKTEDVVFIDIDQVDEDFHVVKAEHMSSFEKLSKDDFLRQQMTGKINWGGVRKAVKRELLLNNKIGFSKDKIGEEAIYSFLILWNAESFSFINGAVYDYVNRVGSQSDFQMDDPWGEVALALKRKIMEMNLYTKYANTINAFIITAAIVSLDKMALKYEYRDYRKIAKERIRYLCKNIDLQYSIDFHSLDKKAIALYPFFKLGWVTPVYIISHLRRFGRNR